MNEDALDAQIFRISTPHDSTHREQLQINNQDAAVISETLELMSLKLLAIRNKMLGAFELDEAVIVLRLSSASAA